MSAEQELGKERTLEIAKQSCNLNGMRAVVTGWEHFHGRVQTSMYGNVIMDLPWKDIDTIMRRGGHFFTPDFNKHKAGDADYTL